jgi:hypothetical protein
MCRAPGILCKIFLFSFLLYTNIYLQVVCETTTENKQTKKAEDDEGDDDSGRWMTTRADTIQGLETRRAPAIGMFFYFMFYLTNIYYLQAIYVTMAENDQTRNMEDDDGGDWRRRRLHHRGSRCVVLFLCFFFFHFLLCFTLLISIYKISTRQRQRQRHQHWAVDDDEDGYSKGLETLINK